MKWLEWVANFMGTRGAQRTETVQVAAPAADQGAADAAYREGVIAFDVRDYPAALRSFATAVHLRHDDADAHNYLGLIHLKQEHYEDAADCFAMAVHFRPAFADAYYNLALAAQRREDHHAAVDNLQRAIAARPDYAEAYNALGASILALGDPQQAVLHFGKAVELRPDDAHAHSNLGYVLFRDLGEFERGAAHLKTAVNLNKNDASIWCNYCSVLAHEGRLDEAISVYDQLLAVKPELHEARLNRALAKLKQGRFAEAWPDYEARKLTRSNYIPRPFVFPEWHGEPLADKTVLVYAEQGLGDEIMFASCLPDLLARGGRCVLECSPRLERLLRRSFPGTTVHASEQENDDTSWLARVGPVDCQVAIGSLPGFFRRQWSDFPRHGGYLHADAARVDYWRERLRALGARIHIGISWRGGMISTRRQTRSMRLTELLPLMQRKDVAFVSLQYGECSAEIEALWQSAGVRMHHWEDAINDYDETAALVEALDLVIAVQTAIVHLAGAMGKSAWAMVPANGEWRYLASGTKMPWYPSVLLFRQQARGDWSLILDRIARRLAAPDSTFRGE